MRKNYLSALLFGALLVASAGTFTSCKDYDDEINNLQEQVDALKNKVTVSPDEMKTAVSEAISTLEAKLNEAISGKADATEVKELLAKVTELQDLVNSNTAVNEEQIESLKKEIESLKASVNEIPGTLDALRDELQKQKEETTAKIEDIEEKINQSQAAATDELKKQLEDLLDSLAETNNKLSGVDAMAKDNANAIVEIKSTLETLKDLNSKIESLQKYKADTSYVDEQIEALKKLIPTDYLTTEGVDAAIQSALEDYVSLEYMAAYSTTSEIKYLIGDAVANTLSAVEVMIKDAFIANGYDQKEFEAVVSHLASVNSALTTNGFTDIADFVKTVNDLETNYSVLAGLVGDENSGLVKDVDGLKSWMESAQKEMRILQDEVDALQQAIGDIFSMVKSIVYIPEYNDRQVQFQNIQFKNESGEWVTKYNDDSKTLTFRVSPATAAVTLAERYDIKLYDDLNVTSRSENSNFEIVDGIVADKENIGLITVKLKSITDKASRAIALALEPKSFYNQYDNITSDYIVAKTSTVKIEDVKYVYSPSNNATIFYNGDETDEKQADFSKGDWQVKLFEETDFESMSNYPLIQPTDFDVKYSLGGPNMDLFNIDTKGIVTLKENIISNVGKTVNVYSNVKLDGFELSSQNSKYNIGTVEVKAKAITVTAPSTTLEYSGNAAQTIKVDMLTLLASKGFDSAFIEDILREDATSTSTVDTYGSTTASPVTVNTVVNEYKLEVSLPSKTVSGTHNIIATLSSSTSETKVEVIVPVTIKDAILPYLLKPNRIPERWQGDIVTLNPRATGTSLIYNDYSFDSMFNWGDYNDFKSYKSAIESLGGSVTISGLKHKGVNVTGYDGITLQSDNTLDINPATYRTDVETSLTITTTYGGATEVVDMIIEVVNVSGSWNIITTGTTAQKSNFDLIFRNNGVSDESIITNVKWKDALGERMWENNAFVESYANSTPAGFGVKYKIESSDVAMVKRYVKNIEGDSTNGYYVTLNDQNKLDFESTTDVSFNEFEFKIIIEPYAPFGPIEGYDKAANTLTIKLRP